MPIDHNSLAQKATDNLLDAAQELARFRREGQSGGFPFGTVDVIVLLAEALDHAAQIEAHGLERADAETASDELQALGQLQGAVTKFLSDQGIRPAI